MRKFLSYDFLKSFDLIPNQSFFNGSLTVLTVFQCISWYDYQYYFFFFLYFVNSNLVY